MFAKSTEADKKDDEKKPRPKLKIYEEKRDNDKKPKSPDKPDPNDGKK